jgi:hypothetical protein
MRFYLTQFFWVSKNHDKEGVPVFDINIPIPDWPKNPLPLKAKKRQISHTWKLVDQESFFSTVMTLPEPASQECTGSCHVNVLAQKGVSSQFAIVRWSDCIVQDRDSCHLGTLSTILQHFTHNETQWTTAARWCRFAMRDVSCRQSWHLSTPSHPRVSPE